MKNVKQRTKPQYNRQMPRVVWITGLPGSGKSTIATLVKERMPDAVVLRMDELRRVVTPQPSYSDSEREQVYRSLVFVAKTLYELGHTVIIDATGNRKSWRELARRLIPRFIEVYLHCPVRICAEREGSRVDAHGAPERIYEKGREGWPVPGVNVPYEEPERPDLTIHTEEEPPSFAAEKIVKLINE